MFADSHIHLTRASFEGTVPCIVSKEKEEPVKYMNRKQLIDEMKNNGIAFCIEPAIDFESNYKILKLAKEYKEFIYVAAGVHPTRTSDTSIKKRRELEKLSENENIVAIGELGLDYHLDRKKQHRFRQKCWFIWQIKLAYKRQLPLILHIRLADKDAIKILRRYRKKINGGVCHCFNGTVQTARIYTKELGFMLGIGASLFKEECQELEKAVIDTPLEYLILETDGPYVKPEKPENISGKKWKKARNTSLIIPDIAKKIAKLKGIDAAEVERVTTNNVIRLFNISIQREC